MRDGAPANRLIGKEGIETDEIAAALSLSDKVSGERVRHAPVLYIPKTRGAVSLAISTGVFSL